MLSGTEENAVSKANGWGAGLYIWSRMAAGLHTDNALWAAAAALWVAAAAL
jgi:hypothetical protein